MKLSENNVRRVIRHVIRENADDLRAFAASVYYDIGISPDWFVTDPKDGVVQASEHIDWELGDKFEALGILELSVTDNVYLPGPRFEEFVAVMNSI